MPAMAPGDRAAFVFDDCDDGGIVFVSVGEGEIVAAVVEACVPLPLAHYIRFRGALHTSVGVLLAVSVVWIG